MLIFKKWFVWLFFLLYIISFFICSIPIQATYDFLNYYLNPDLFYSDWHPIWMKYKLKFVADILFSDEDRISSMVSLAFIYYAVLWIGAHGLILYSIRKKFYTSLIYVALLFFLLFAWPQQLIALGADLVFSAQLIFLVSICFYATAKKLHSRWVFYLLILLLWDTVTWRHQAILLIPLFVWYISKLHPTMLYYSWMKRMGVSFLYSVVLFAWTQILYYKVFNADRTHPETAMIYSDLENIASLTKDASFKENFQREFGFIPYAKISADGWLETPYSLGQFYGFIGNIAQPRIRYTDRYIFLKKHWLNSIITYPKEFVTARCVNYIQLLHTGFVPDQVVSYVRKHYPHVQIYSLGAAYSSSSNPFTFFIKQREAGASIPYLLFRSLALKSQFASYLVPILYPLIYLWLALSVPLLYFKARRDSSPILCLSQLCSWSSLIYLIGFLPFTPTCDFRFTAPSLILGLLGLFFYLVTLGRKTNLNS